MPSQLEVEKKEFYRIPRYNHLALVEKLESINKRARKNGLPEVEHEVVGGETVEEPDNHLNEDGVYVVAWRYREFLFVRVEGKTPNFAGWEFVAALDHPFGAEGASLIRTAPHHEGDVPTEYRSRGNVCDHCGQKRGRKKTYLLHHEDDTWKQVGSTCIIDFLGSYGTNPESVAEAAESLFRLDSIVGEYEGPSESGGGGGRYEGTSLADYLPVVAGFIRVLGWVSRGKAHYDDFLVATADKACSWLWDTKYRNSIERDEPDNYHKLVDGRELDTKTAALAVAWVEKEFGAKEQRSDYEHNLLVLAQEGWAPEKSFGLAASMVACHLRHLEKLQEQESLARASKNEYFGEEGKRLTVKASIVKLRTVESFYGESILTGFVTEDGCSGVWFNSGSQDVQKFVSYNDKEALLHEGPGLELGDHVWITGTVKKHEQYNERCQTTLNRCKVFRFDPDDKETKKRIRALKKLDLVFKREFEWEGFCHRENLANGSYQPEVS